MGFFSKLIGGAASIFGGPLGGLASGIVTGALDRRSARKATSAANAYNDPSAIRDRYEAAGFNPLMGVQNGAIPYQNVQSNGFFGKIGADAMAFYQRHQQQEIERSALSLQQRQAQERASQRVSVASEARPRIVVQSGASSTFEVNPVNNETITDATGRELSVTTYTDGSKDYIDLSTGQPVIHAQATFLGSYDGGIYSGVALNPEALEMDGSAAGMANLGVAGLDGVSSTPTFQGAGERLGDFLSSTNPNNRPQPRPRPVDPDRGAGMARDIHLMTPAQQERWLRGEYVQPSIN